MKVLDHAQHVAAAPWGSLIGVVSGPLADRRAPPVGQSRCWGQCDNSSRDWRCRRASILVYTAATQPALPTGFWDQAPRPPPGRLRRVLAQMHFQGLPELPQQLRITPSVSREPGDETRQDVGTSSSAFMSGLPPMQSPRPWRARALRGSCQALGH
jgi:hypothetical protein